MRAILPALVDTSGLGMVAYLKDKTRGLAFVSNSCYQQLVPGMGTKHCTVVDVQQVIPWLIDTWDVVGNEVPR